MTDNDNKESHLVNGLTKSPISLDQDAKVFANIFINSPIGIYIVQDGKFVFMNPEFLRISGFDEQELLGTNSLEIVLPEDREKVRHSAVEMLKGNSDSPYDHRVLTKNGEIRWIIETVIPIDYKGSMAVLGYFMDNTNCVRIREALSISEDKFQKAFRSSPAWFVISTLEDGFYIDVNEAFLRATGYTREEVIGRTSIELGIWADPEQRADMVGILRRKGAVRNLEVRFRTKSGRIRYVLWSAEVIEYGDEKCLLAVTRDITARRRALRAQLEQEKLQGVLEIAGATCHEINQPLQYLYLLLSEVMEANPEDEALHEIKKQCDRIRGIMKKMESITVYESTEYIRGKKIVDINQAANNK